MSSEQVQSAIYTTILEDIAKGDAIIEETDRIYRTDDATIYTGFSNVSNTFNIQTKDTDKVLLPSESTLRVVFQLTNSGDNDIYGRYVDGPDVPSVHPARNQLTVDPDSIYAGVATLVAGGLHLFKQARLIIDNNQVELVNDPGIVHITEHLINSSRDKIREAAENEWLWLDEGSVTTGQFAVGVSATSNDFINSYAAFTGAAATVNDSYGYAEVRQIIERAADNAGGPQPKYNRGFAMRWMRTMSKIVTPGVSSSNEPSPLIPSVQAGVEVELAIPITRLFGYFADIRSAYRGVKFEIELTKNTDYAEIIHGRGITYGPDDRPEAATAHTLIKRIEWAVPTVIPSTTVLERMQSDLASGEMARKVFSSTQVYLNNIASGADANSDVDWRIQSTGKKISRVVVAFQRAAQYGAQNDPTNPTVNVNLHSNGGVFSPLNDIKKVEIRLGSTILPKEPFSGLTLADAAPVVARNYVEFLQAGGRWLGDDGAAIDIDTWRRLYPMFVFDLSRTSIDQRKMTSQDLRVITTVDTPSNYRIIALVTYDYDVDFAGIDGRLAVKLP